jgi:uncharacterized protein YjbI with pentapeptide repeats
MRLRRKIWRLVARCLATFRGRSKPWTAQLVKSTVRSMLVGLSALLVFVFTLLIFVYPSEWVYDWGVRSPFRTTTELLLEGYPDRLHGKPSSLLGSNRLVLPDQNLGIEEKLSAWHRAAKDGALEGAEPADARVSLSLRGRNLYGIVLDRTDLRQADFTGADLREASLRAAKLDRAILQCTQDVMFLYEIDCVQLQGADLSEAQLQDSKLGGARLQGAALRRARLQGSTLVMAQLQGADLRQAQLQNADLREAQLQGAYLSEAQLHGAILTHAQLQGALLYKAQLQGADLRQAQLQGAYLQLAQLQGAILRYTQLQGADLQDADLQGATLVRANVYRTRCPVAAHRLRACLSDRPAADTVGIDQSRMIQDLPSYFRLPFGARVTADDSAGYREFVNASVVGILSDSDKQRVRIRLAILAPNQARKQFRAALDYHQLLRWHHERRRSLSPALRSQILAELACEEAGAPYVARALIRKAVRLEWYGRLAATGSSLKAIAERMRKSKPGPQGVPIDANACPGVRGFTEKDWQSLSDLEKRVSDNKKAVP